MLDRGPWAPTEALQRLDGVQAISQVPVDAKGASMGPAGGSCPRAGRPVQPARMSFVATIADDALGTGELKFRT